MTSHRLKLWTGGFLLGYLLCKCVPGGFNHETMESEEVLLCTCGGRPIRVVRDLNPAKCRSVIGIVEWGGFCWSLASERRPNGDEVVQLLYAIAANATVYTCKISKRVCDLSEQNSCVMGRKHS